MQVSLFDFQPANDIVNLQNNFYRSTGVDPHFLFKNDVEFSDEGVYLFECTINSLELTFRPYLYIDTGEGFSEGTKIALPSPSDDAIKVLITLPPNVRYLRFDPCEEAGSFSLTFLRIRRLNKLEQLCVLSSPYLHKIKSDPRLAIEYLKKAIGLVFSGRSILHHLNKPREQIHTYATWYKEAQKTYGFKGVNKSQIYQLKYKPKISILMPTYNTKNEFLNEAVNSIIAQSYENWELCIADDASPDPAFREFLNKVAARDQRIRVVWRETNGHISAASNSALEICTGDFVSLVDHDDLVHKEALAEFILAINSDDNIDVWYTDEDKLTSDGHLANPTLKPDWSPHLLFSQQYLGHMVCIKRSAITNVGGFDTSVNGAQDYDLLLRLANQGCQFGHIPKVLYHWREHENSTAANPHSKPYAHVAGELSVSRALIARYGALVTGAEEDQYLFTYRPIFSQELIKPVSIIIPTRDRIDLLSICIKSIFDKTIACEYEIIIVDNGSQEKETFEYFDQLKKLQNIKVVRADIEFNWSKLNNIGVKHSSYDIFVFLNNDIEVIEPKWLFWLSAYANLPDVGSVGALLLYPDKTIQHAGVVLGMSGWADHVYKAEFLAHMGTPFTSPVLARNVLANTGACMAIAREKFNQVGGFDEEFIVCGSDVEICLRLEKLLLKNVYCPYAKLFHFESKSRDPSKVPENDFKQSALKYEPYRTIQCDPYFNPNLDIWSPVPKLKH